MCSKPTARLDYILTNLNHWTSTNYLSKDKLNQNTIKCYLKKYRKYMRACV